MSTRAKCEQMLDVLEKSVASQIIKILLFSEGDAKMEHELRWHMSNQETGSKNEGKQSLLYYRFRIVDISLWFATDWPGLDITDWNMSCNWS